VGYHLIGHQDDSTASGISMRAGIIVIRVSPGIVFPCTHIPRDACFAAHISLIIHILQVIVICVSLGILFSHHLYADLDAD